MVGRVRLFGRDLGQLFSRGDDEDVRGSRQPARKRYRRDWPPNLRLEREFDRSEEDQYEEDDDEELGYQDDDDDEIGYFAHHQQDEDVVDEVQVYTQDIGEEQLAHHAYEQDEDDLGLQLLDEEQLYPEDNGDDEHDYIEDEAEAEEPNYEPISDEPINITLNDPGVFDCSICFEPLTIPVFQCENNGHIACSYCSCKIQRCPSCSSPFGSNRCRIIEKVLESSTVSCRNSKYGCRETMTYDKKREHERACMHLPCSCPHPGCDFAASYWNLYKHFDTNHPNSATRFRFNREFSITLKKDEKFIVLQERIEGTMFILKNRVIEGVGNAVRLHCLRPSYMKESYAYKLGVKTNGDVLKLQSSTKNSSNQVYDVPPSSMATFLLIPLHFSRSDHQLRMTICILRLMKMFWREYYLLLVLCTFIFSGFEAEALPYDYTATIECLANPQKPKYGGGIIMNPEFDNGLKGWSSFGHVKLQHKESQGNKFLVAQNRSQQHDSMSQKVYLQADKLYTFSAWIQVSGGSGVSVVATFKTASGYLRAGEIIAESNCWSMLNGGLTVEASGDAELYFESKDTSVQIWVDSVSLQPFTKKEWKSHQDQSIIKNRKSKVRIQAVDARGNPLPNATVFIEQKYPSFPFGCSMTKLILNNPAHQNWFTSRFRVTTFGDEMKWYTTEYVQGHEDYSVADAMLQFTQQNHIAVRGHNVFWDDPQYQLGWVKSLNQQQLESATNKRLNSVMQRYKGKVIAWDVVNENLHFNFFESKLGPNASAMFYNWAIKADGETPLFLNDYNTIEESSDEQSSPAKYLQKLREIKSFPGNAGGRYAIGLESHFANVPNIPYIRSSLDTLGAAKVPIWITELDVSSKINQALYLEQLLRELHSHPQIQGIIMWAGRGPQGCYQMCLTDENFKNLATGDVVDKLLREWGYWTSKSFTTNSNGYFEASLLHGDYDVKISHSSTVDSSRIHKLNVVSTTRSLQLSV